MQRYKYKLRKSLFLEEYFTEESFFHVLLPFYFTPLPPASHDISLDLTKFPLLSLNQDHP